MVTLFRKLLIRAGKVFPFLLAFIVSVGYIENIYSVLTDRIAVDEYGMVFYYCPISMFLSNIVYIDWFDVFLLYVLAVALEYCKYNLRAVHFLLLNLLIRTLVEHVWLDGGIVVGIASFMALAGLYCVYGGFKMLVHK